MPRKDLIGNRYGKLLVIGQADDIDRHSAWLCMCDCGREKIVSVKNLLRKDHDKSCGCLRSEKCTLLGKKNAGHTKYHIEIGDKFEALIVVSNADPIRLVCNCICGKQITISPYNLINTKSCGCLSAGRRKNRIGERNGVLTIVNQIEQKYETTKLLCRCICGEERVIYPETFGRGRIKGCLCQPVPISNHYLKGTFYNMVRRCTNPRDQQYVNYGARGITVFPAWLNNPRNFFEYIDTHLGTRPSPQHTLDRIDNDRGYEPDNLRWADRQTQTDNRRINAVVKNAKGYTNSILTECLSLLYSPKSNRKKYTRKSIPKNS